MAKADVISGQMSAFQAQTQKVQQDFFGEFYDAVAADVGASGSTVDMGMSADQEKTAIQAAVAEAKAASDQAIQALQTKFDNLSSKEQAELKGIGALKQQFQKVQDALSNVMGLMPAQAATDENAAAGVVVGGGDAGAAPATADNSGKPNDNTVPSETQETATSPGPATGGADEGSVPSPAAP